MDTARDVVIVVWGIIITLAVIFLTVIAYLIYKKIDAILKSVKNTAREIEAITLVAGEEISRPLIQVAGVAQGLAWGARTISKIFKKENCNDERQ